MTNFVVTLILRNSSFYRNLWVVSSKNVFRFGVGVTQNKGYPKGPLAEARFSALATKNNT